MSLENLTLTGARSQYEGGAIATWEDLTLEGVTIKGNQSVGYAGGLYVSGSTVVINNSTFEDNRIVENSAGVSKGGAIYAEGVSNLTYR